MSENSCAREGSEREAENNDHGRKAEDDEIMEILDSDEEVLLDAHKGLSAQGDIIDLTNDI